METKMLIVYLDWGECGIYVNDKFEGNLPCGCDGLQNLQNFVSDKPDFKFKNIKTVWPGNIEDEVRKNGWFKTTEFLRR